MQKVQNEGNTGIVGFGRLGMVMSDCTCEIEAAGPGVVTVAINHAGGSHVLNMDVDSAEQMSARLYTVAQTARRMCLDGE